MRYSIPRLVIAATQSGSGKTTIATGLLSALREQGIAVQSFKVGPDYIAPGYHTMASGRPAHNLDSWLVPEQVLPELFTRTMEGSDIAVIEGVMGLYDGGREGVSSTAAIAKLLKAPVVLVLDAKSMGASAAAIACGFRDYDPKVNLAGVILNRLGSATHEEMIRRAMKDAGIRVLGALRRDDSLKMPERHLGLVPVAENEGERQAIEAMGTAVAKSLDIEAILHLACLAPELEVVMPERKMQPRCCRFGIARDEAFSFYYTASLAILAHCGAELVPFSPLHDAELPEVDGLFIGGGFPEMFAEQLEANASMCASIKKAAENGMPIYAECGGYMYLLQSLKDFLGREHAMCGALPGRAAMTDKLQMVGYVEAELLEDTVLGKAGTKLRGHEFHFSEDEVEGKRPLRFERLRTGECYEAGESRRNVLGSYLHLHFAGCPEAAAHFVEACSVWAR